MDRLPNGVSSHFEKRRELFNKFISLGRKLESLQEEIVQKERDVSLDQLAKLYENLFGYFNELRTLLETITKEGLSYDSVNSTSLESLLDSEEEWRNK